MPITRSFDNANQLVDWTDEINMVPNQYGFIRSQNLFRTQGTSQTAIVFDKLESEITLLPQVNRRSREATVGKDRKVETFSMPLAYFKHQDYITPEDIQGWRRAGTPDQAETLDNVRLQKMEDMRRTVDQTLEYMQIQAAKGITKSPDGVIVADMFDEFNITRPEIDFDLGNSGTVVNDKIAQLKRGVGANLKSGGVLRGINVIVGEAFFDKLVNHPSVREAYLNWSSNAQYRDDQSRYMNWGIMDTFYHKGVMFMTYPAVFNLPTGQTEKPVEDNEGMTIPVVDGLFRGYYGPANKLSLANQAGVEMFMFEYPDPHDEGHELQVETSPLFFATRPAVLYRVYTSS